MMTRAKVRLAVGAAVVLAGIATGAASLWPAADAAAPRPADPPAKAKPADPPAKDKPAAAAPAGEKIKPGDRLRFRARNVFDSEPLDGVYLVEPAGTVALPPVYGPRVKVAGLTLEEAEAVVLEQLKVKLRDPMLRVTVYDPVAYDPVADSRSLPLETRVRLLEEQVRDLKAAVEELKRKR